MVFTYKKKSVPIQAVKYSYFPIFYYFLRNSYFFMIIPTFTIENSYFFKQFLLFCVGVSLDSLPISKSVIFSIGYFMTVPQCKNLIYYLNPRVISIDESYSSLFLSRWICFRVKRITNSEVITFLPWWYYPPVMHREVLQTLSKKKKQWLLQVTRLKIQKEKKNEMLNHKGTKDCSGRLFSAFVSYL